MDSLKFNTISVVLIAFALNKTGAVLSSSKMPNFAVLAVALKLLCGKGIALSVTLVPTDTIY